MLVSLNEKKRAYLPAMFTDSQSLLQLPELAIVFVRVPRDCTPQVMGRAVDVGVWGGVAVGMGVCVAVALRPGVAVGVGVCVDVEVEVGVGVTGTTILRVNEPVCSNFQDVASMV